MINPNNISNEFSWIGIYRAKVIDSKDSLKQGRVKVWCPDLMPEVDDSLGLWARPANNFLGGRNTQVDAGDDHYFQGSCIIPPIGSWWYVFFEYGDPNQPRYLSACDIGASKVPIENQQGLDFDKKWTLMKSRQGRTIIVSDDDYDGRVEITGKKRLLQSNLIDDVQQYDGNGLILFITNFRFNVGKNELDVTINGLPQKLYEDYKEINTNTIEFNLPVVGTLIIQKKSSITDPAGNPESVYAIDDNQTVILIDERPGIEKILIKDYKGNYINVDTTNDQLNVQVNGDVHINSGGNVFFSCDGDLDMSVGGNYSLDVRGNYSVNCSKSINQKARLDFNARGLSALSMKSGGIIGIDGSQTWIQSGVAVSASPIIAVPAEPNGDRIDPITTTGPAVTDPEPSETIPKTIINNSTRLI